MIDIVVDIDNGLYFVRQDEMDIAMFDSQAQAQAFVDSLN